MINAVKQYQNRFIQDKYSPQRGQTTLTLLSYPSRANAQGLQSSPEKH